MYNIGFRLATLIFASGASAGPLQTSSEGAGKAHMAYIRELESVWG